MWSRTSPVKSATTAGKGYIDSETFVRLHNMSPEDGERDYDVEVVILRYTPTQASH